MRPKARAVWRDCVRLIIAAFAGEKETVRRRMVGMSWQKLVLALCVIAAVAWVSSEAVRFHREEVAPKTGLYWVLAGQRPLVVGDDPASVMIPPGLAWSDFNRAVDVAGSEAISYFLLRSREFEFDPWYARSMEYRASNVAYILRKPFRRELYRLYRQDERDDRAAAWSKVSDRATRAFVPAATLLAFAGAMWWALAAFDPRARPREPRGRFVRLWLVLSVAWMVSYAVIVPLLEPPRYKLSLIAHGRRGAVPVQIQSSPFGWHDEQAFVSWMIGLLIVPVVLIPLLAACEASQTASVRRRS
jgi:hypothetical protein